MDSSIHCYRIKVSFDEHCRQLESVHHVCSISHFAPQSHISFVRKLLPLVACSAVKL